MKTKEVKVLQCGIEDFVWEENETQRIRKNTQECRNLSIAEAFEKVYNVVCNTELKTDSTVNTVCNIEMYGLYVGIVKEFTKDTMEITLPGVKEQLICNENFNNCFEAIQNYLLNHENKICFEVREKQDGKYYVSVINAYYKIWNNSIENMIKKEVPITVHIDELVKGGYLCHCPIKHICDLTGLNYTSSVFIPGSQIVLNIEDDFQKWIGEDVQIIPQKMMKFNSIGDLDQNSLIGSRKKLLQNKGMQNLYKIYNLYRRMKNENTELSPTDFVYKGVITGIINSNQKTGVFVELNDEYITGLMNCSPNQLLDFRKGDEITVRINQFEVQEGKDPFVIYKNKVVRCNTRCIFDYVA